MFGRQATVVKAKHINSFQTANRVVKYRQGLPCCILRIWLMNIIVKEDDIFYINVH